MFRISLDALLILDAIDRLGSFAAAGNELYKVPSTISYTVSKLEQDLGVQVFERLGPKVAITKAGSELLKEGRHLLKAASDLEHRVRRVASGWETELTIGMDSVFSPTSLIHDVTEFCKVADLTRLKFSQETLSGTWEALLDRRVDLLVGAAGEGPSGGGYHSHLIGYMDFVFAVSPNHPLAGIASPLSKADLSQHLAITVSDSVRKMQPRTVGLLFGQNTLAVSNMRAKYEYQLAGMGFGFLPEAIARQAIASGLLVIKEVEEPRKPEPVYLAWRTEEVGAGLTWWIDKMKSPNLLERLWPSFN
ncbi:LysR family transcriptional regulator [Methylotenera versatilis]|uniref:Transcriptional regulator, LysR family n=1 Tax=Methylotenera versatilis (strain 301) TaxID=666681 RepID=D7DPJ9_METV0|nr:LysR family transcriptional regulator [Methylotenera versatilis]ADI29243.1 transcriptional regulator, LysR family [Methylotenera versatilis 301]